jgi:hypothetical protein
VKCQILALAYAGLQSLPLATIRSGGASIAGAIKSSLWIAFKHRRQRYVQGLANGEQPRRANALLIFLNLLERNAQGLGEVCLAYTEHVPALAHPSADKFVDRI